MSCRYTLDVLIAGEDAPFNRQRHLTETCLIVFGSLAVALAFPTSAEKIFAVTGVLVKQCHLSPAAWKNVCMRACSVEGRRCTRTPDMLEIVLNAIHRLGGLTHWHFWAESCDSFMIW